MIIKVKESKVKIIFMGTADFAVPILEKLSETGYRVVTVITQPDKLWGPKQILKISPIKEVALKHKLALFQPENIASRQAQHLIRNLKPDLIIVASYGQIIPRSILNVPKFGSLNIHASLLPKYRGASPIQQAILRGETMTGVTIIMMDEKLDHGPIISQEKIKIETDETAQTLHNKLSHLGCLTLIKILPAWLEGKIKPVPQDETRVTYTKILKREDGRLDWQSGAQVVERIIRAYSPWPGAWTTWQPRSHHQYRVKIFKAYPLDLRYTPGKVFLTKQNQLAVGCGQQSLVLEEIQLAGKRKMTSKEFLRGHLDILGTILS